VAAAHPDLFIYLGDNIYGDSRNMDELRAKYAKLAAKPEFRHLCKTVPVIATWDDHDYGENDAGRHYPYKEDSREIFLDFWNEPANSARREHAGVYHSLLLGPPDKRVQVILLDTRTFRDNILSGGGPAWKNDYYPNENPDSTFLGAEQWAWLGEQLKIPARLRVIASSNQFGHSYNGWESWTNVPREREKMLALIRDTRAEGVVFISGDVHWGELSRLNSEGLYPIYDLTSSGITQNWPNVEDNENRVESVVRENNFGMLLIDWEKEELTFELRNKKGRKALGHTLPFSELKFP
jgi:alkaline phosphatase D